MNDFLKKMFIDQAKPAMKRHSGSGGSSSGGGIIEVDELPSPTILDPNNSGPVVNSGHVEKVYFNTSLSEEEVLAELDKLTYMVDLPMNILLFKSDQSMILVSMKQDTMCAIADFATNTYYWVNSDASTQMQLSYVGWNPDFNGEVEINSEVVSEFNGMAVGAENDKITNLFYMGAMLPNPDFDPEAIYQLPDETLWMYENEEWIELVERPDLESLNVTENGTYTPSVENTYYNEVTVDVQPSLESINLTKNGTYTPSAENTYYNAVTVNVQPSKSTKYIYENGTYDVIDYKSAKVSVPLPSGTVNITENGTHDVTNYVSAVVNIDMDAIVAEAIKGDY